MNGVLIIIVNWNTGELLARCLSSLARLPKKELIREIIVVDNASSDRSVAAAQVAVGQSGNKPPVRFIKLVKNVGFAAANNIILQRETGSVSAIPGNGKLTSEIFTIISKGINADGSIKRSVKAVVHNRSDKMEIVYWNDNFIR